MDPNSSFIIQGNPAQHISFPCCACRKMNEFVPLGPINRVRCYVCSNITEIKLQMPNQSQFQQSYPNSRASFSGSTSFTGNENFQGNTNTETHNPKSEENSPAKQEDFYELLGISKQASLEEIKKAYYKKARQYHPDKNPDPDSQEKFRKISEAYQILSQPDLREKYDKYGPDGLKPGGGFVDPKDFFNIMFGGGKFQKFIGDVFLSATIGKDVPRQEKERLYAERISTLAEILAKRLDTYEKNPKNFEQEAQKDVNELKSEQFGVEILQTIGYIYDQKATQYSGGVLGFFADVTSTGHKIKGTYTAISAAVKLQQSHDQFNNEQDQARKAALEQQLLNDGINAIWKIGKLDVEDVLRRVCDVVLNPQLGQLQKKRIQALKTLGRIFSETK